MTNERRRKLAGLASALSDTINTGNTGGTATKVVLSEQDKWEISLRASHWTQDDSYSASDYRGAFQSESAVKAAEAEFETLRQKAISFAIKAQKITICAEDGETDGTMLDLELAINDANSDQLARFLKTGRIRFEDGYLTIRGVTA